jgi:hypothetical protein
VLNLSDSFAEGDSLFLSDLLFMRSHVFGETLLFPEGSAEFVSFQDHAMTVEFHFPVVTNYTAVLKCGISNVSWALNFSLTQFSRPSNYSQFLCRGSGFLHRWCLFRNLGWVDRCFQFYSPAIFKFPQPFLIPGPRSAPFDRASDRLIIEPFVMNMPYHMIPRDFQISTNVSVIFGVYHNAHMLWHFLFDFFIPVYRFMQKWSIGNIRERQIYIIGFDLGSFVKFLKIFSNREVVYLDEEPGALIFKHGSLGLEKSEIDLRPDRNVSNSLQFEYDYSESTINKMRQSILLLFQVAGQRSWPPSILIIVRGDDDIRSITNMKEVKAHIAETCDFCVVKTVRLHKQSLKSQVGLVAGAAVLIGAHGSGLSNTLWQKNGSHLIEILPYGYWCRKWYEMAANISGVHYHSVMNENRSIQGDEGERAFRKFKQCWNKREACMSSPCHDILRDQVTKVELDTFDKVWLPIVEKFRTKEEGYWVY